MQSNLVSLTRNTEVEIRRLWSVTAALTKMLGREPKEGELIAELKWDERKLRDVLDAAALSKGMTSLDVGQDDDGETNQGVEVETSGLDDEDGGFGGKETAEDLISHSLLEKEIEDILVQISPRTLQVFQMRHGLGGRERLTLNQISQALGVTVEGIRQIELKAMARIRRNRQLRAMITSSLLDSGVEVPVRSGYVRKS